MASEQKNSVTWYLRMFSYLLILCGAAVGIAGVAVAYQTVAESATAGLALEALVLGLAIAIVGGITLAVGIMGHAASRDAAQLGSLHTFALVDIVASIIGLGLCYAASGDLPIPLVFNLLLVGVCIVIANSVQKASA